MFPPSRLLFPTDFSTCAEGAYRHAAYLADRFGAEVHVLHIVDHENDPVRDWPEVAAPEHLQVSMADICADLGLPLPPGDTDELQDRVPVVEEEVVGHASEAILAYILDEEIDLVVMGTHGRRGWRRGVLGSVAEAVVRRAPCPVLTVRPLEAPGGEAWPPGRVLLALDAAPEDAEAYGRHDLPAAARWAAGLAVAYEAPLELLHVVRPARLGIGGAGEVLRARRAARRALQALADALQAETEAPLRTAVSVRTGEPAPGVHAAADEARTHLLVVGTHGRRGVGRALLGSVAETLVRTAPCPVLVARDRVIEEAPEAAPAHGASAHGASAS